MVGEAQILYPRSRGKPSTSRPSAYQAISLPASEPTRISGTPSLSRSARAGEEKKPLGLYFGHPEARYFAVDRLTRDLVESYAARKGMPLAEVERWLAPVLGYDP